MLEAIVLLMALACCALVLISFGGSGLLRIRDRQAEPRMATKPVIRRRGPRSR